MSQELVSIKITKSTQKRLKLLSIVKKQPIPELLEELIKEQYGIHRDSIEDLVRSANVPTKIKE